MTLKVLSTKQILKSIEEHKKNTSDIFLTEK